MGDIDGRNGEDRGAGARPALIFRNYKLYTCVPKVKVALLWMSIIKICYINIAEKIQKRILEIVESLHNKVILGIGGERLDFVNHKDFYIIANTRKRNFEEDANTPMGSQ